MAADRQTDRHTHNFRKCSHASVGLAQACPNEWERLENMWPSQWNIEEARSTY